MRTRVLDSRYKKYFCDKIWLSLSQLFVKTSACLVTVNIILAFPDQDPLLLIEHKMITVAVLGTL